MSQKKNWIIGGAAVAVIAVGAYFSFGGHNKETNKTVTIGVMAGDKK